MALKDVKAYYAKMLLQYLEMKQDLADFEQALKDGFITEEQLADLKADVNIIETNYHRLAYIMYLLELPQKKTKKAKYKKANIKLENYFNNIDATVDFISNENISALNGLREHIKSLKTDSQE